MYNSSDKEFDVLNYLDKKLPAGLERRYANNHSSVTFAETQIDVTELSEDFDADFVVRVRNNHTYESDSANVDTVEEARRVAVDMWSDLRS